MVPRTLWFYYPYLNHEFQNSTVITLIIVCILYLTLELYSVYAVLSEII